MRLNRRNFHESDIEVIFREALEKRGYRRGIDFAMEYPIRGSYIIDIAFPEQRIAIELDGEQYHSLPPARKRDGHKNMILKRDGWVVYRFWGEAIRKDVQGCIDKIQF